jgi:hypothetical protein
MGREDRISALVAAVVCGCVGACGDTNAPSVFGEQTFGYAGCGEFHRCVG